MGNQKKATGIRLDDDLLQAIDELAKKSRTQRSALVRQLIDEALQARAQKDLATPERASRVEVELAQVVRDLTVEVRELRHSREASPQHRPAEAERVSRK